MSSHWARPKRLGKSYVWLESPEGELQITMGPHWPGVIAVVLMVLAGTWMDFSVIDNIPPTRRSLLLLFKASSIFFVISTIVALFLTACSDPGIVRVTPISDKDDADDDLSNTSYCEICSVHQPERLQIRHCYDCDVCIMGHDHHCPWMGKCIGKKNMR
jgi:hypothetical protein